MAMRIRKLGRNGKGRFHLALAYLIWSLLPHFHVLFHSHAGGAHFHATFDPAQVSLANRVMDNLEGSGLRGAAMAEVGGEALNASQRPAGVESLSIPALGLGDTGLKAGQADPNRHGHFWEDPNLAGMASSIAAALAVAALILAAAAAYPSPDLRALRRFPARGPPAFLPA
jgi:hypothetical protein